MNNKVISFAVLNKNRNSAYVLKNAQASFEVFQSDYIEISKTVDRPDDYYFIDDDITFIIKLKNVGNKFIRGFLLKDDAPSVIAPLESGYYEVISPVGNISFVDGDVYIENIDLEPNEEVEITITGKVKETMEEEKDITF